MNPDVTQSPKALIRRIPAMIETTNSRVHRCRPDAVGRGMYHSGSRSCPSCAAPTHATAWGSIAVAGSAARASRSSSAPVTTSVVVRSGSRSSREESSRRLAPSPLTHRDSITRIRDARRETLATRIEEKGDTGSFPSVKCGTPLVRVDPHVATVDRHDVRLHRADGFRALSRKARAPWQCRRRGDPGTNHCRSSPASGSNHRRRP